MNLFVSFFLFFAMAGGAAVPSHKVKRAQLGQQFTLRVGEQAILKDAGVKLSFSAVAEDSRCPKGVDCIWAGNGRVIVQIVKGGRKATELQLNTGLDPKEQRFQDYTIKLVQLDPYPQKGFTLKRGDYAATFVVSKASTTNAPLGK